MPDPTPAALSTRERLASNLVRLRIAAGLSVRDLDARAGVPRGTTHHAERCRRFISVAHVANLAHALGVSAAALLSEPTP